MHHKAPGFRPASNRKTVWQPMILALCAGLLLPALVQAIPPAPFSASYEARFGGFKANAERAMEFIDAETIHMSTSMELKLLGQTVSRIQESSSIQIDQETELTRSNQYSFIQSGIGKRQRHINFAWDTAVAEAKLDKLTIDLPLEGNVRDTLSAYLEIRKQLLAGVTEIIFPGIYKGELEEIHYRVIGEENITTELGTFNAVRLQRIREPGSDRTTDIWLAPDWDYLLIKLVQDEPGSSTISLELREANVNNETVTPIITQDE